MPEFTFFVNLADKLVSPSFFYNSKSYIALHSSATTYSFYLCNTKKEEVARIHFEIKNGIAESFPMAPFGGLETMIQEEETLVSFWREVEGVLIKEKVKQILLRIWPVAYPSSNLPFLESFLLREGFGESYSDYNFHLSVTSQTALQFFKKPERKRFRKCLKAGFKFYLSRETKLEEAYDLLERFRAQRSIPLNISKEIFLRSCIAFPDRYLIFLVEDKGNVIALSVCVKVSEEVLYHFCLAYDPMYNSFSPSVMLYEGIYRYCQSEGFGIFDFGTASIKGQKQEGLYAFKEKLGGEVTVKKVFMKQFA